MTTLDEGRAALERGRHVVVVAPPAPEQAGDLWRLLGASPGVVIACPDEACAAAWAAAAPADRRIAAVTGLRRATRLLTTQPPQVLAGSTADLMALVTQSALKLDTVTTLVVAWPEQAASSDPTELETLLGAAPDARRVVLAWNPGALGDFLERHARRAEIVGALPVDAEGKPLSPAGPARYAIAAALPDRRATLLRDTLDQLAPARPFIWEGQPIETSAKPDAVICLRLPTRGEFVTLSGLGGGQPVVFVTGGQLPYLRSIAAPLTPLAFSGAADRARDRAAALRDQIARRIEAGDIDAELAVLDPLFERFDPAEVAAALLALRDVGRGTWDVGRSSGDEASHVTRHTSPISWTKIFLNVGKKDRAAAKDLVGAMIREVGLEKSQIGRIDVRETFSVVEVSPDAAERAVQGLGGVTVRGRRLAARLDRYT